MIQFHFQFPRSPDAAFGGLIECLFNCKCRFSCRIISNILQIVSNTIIFEMVIASIMSCCDFENSQISAQDTVGMGGDDIMFHILVTWISNWLMLGIWD